MSVQDAREVRQLARIRAAILRQNIDLSRYGDATFKAACERAVQSHDEEIDGDEAAGMTNAILRELGWDGWT
jgi:hypothetical protein